MNGYDSSDTPIDPAQAHVAALQTWHSHVVEERARIEHDLLISYRDLIGRYRAKCDEFDREKRNATLWEKEHRLIERELNGLKAAAESFPFAFVVVDGDGAVFREDLIAQGEEGGGVAAHELHGRLKAYLHDNPLFSNIDTIFVQVVLSLDGLSRALHASGTLPINDQTALARFGRGFCRAQPFFSFIDVGYGKEQADHKVRKLFEVMEKNIQCRCLILGGCHDNGYATFLESFRSNQKICLLETTPPAADFRKLSFKRVSFPSVFRSEPIPSRAVAPPGFAPPGFAPPTAAPVFTAPTSSPVPLFNGQVGVTSLPSPAPTISPRPAPPATLASKPEPPSNSYAAIGRSSTPLTINIAPTVKKAAPARLFYQLNKDDERVDVPLAKTDSAAVKSFEDKMHHNGKNFCNRYYLLNNCKSANCNFYHGQRLSAGEMLVLRHKTRNLVCSSGHQCRDTSCNLGHHCSNPGSCYFGNSCRFADMHGMDIAPTIKIYEDGGREVLVN